MGHVRTILADLEDVSVIVRGEDRHAYLMLRYDTGMEVPSWTASDGTLRLLALVEPPEILCFDKNADGASDIVRGSEHPLLRDWQGSIDKAVLFAKRSARSGTCYGSGIPPVADSRRTPHLA